MKKRTNKERVLDYLKERGTATIRDLMLELWIQTPQEYIRLLKKEGYNIETTYCNKDKHGTYILHENEQYPLFKQCEKNGAFFYDAKQHL